MTEKRFKLIADSNLEYLMQAELDLPIYDYNDNEKRLSLKDTLDLLNKLSTEKNELKEKLNSISDIIDEQIWQVNHTHENCKKVGIAELKKLKKVLILNCIIKEELQK